MSATGEYTLTSNLSLQTEIQLQPSQSTQSQTSSTPAIGLSKPNSSYNTVLVETQGVFREGSGKGKRKEEEREGSVRADSEVAGEGKVAEGLGFGGSGKRKRGRQDAFEPGSGKEDEDEEYLPVFKRSQPERKTTGRAIAQALDRLSDTAQTIQYSKVELAVERLQQDYASTFTVDELVKALVIMENEVKASIFIALKAGEARDLWLQEAINKL